MRGRLLLLAGAMLAGCATATNAAEPAWPQGIYGDVRMSGETGDLGGLEVRFYDESGRHMAEFVFCEGWCNTVYRSEVTHDGEGFVFEADEEFTDGQGNSTFFNLRFRAVPLGKGLLVEEWFNGERSEWDTQPRKLKPLKQTFGIDVASFEGDEGE